jgi:uncharacterized protein (DUF885 family)
MRTRNALLLLALAGSAGAQNVQRPPATFVPDLTALVNARDSELRDVVERYTADRQALLRRYRVNYSAAQRGTMAKFYAEWLTKLKAIPFAPLSQDGKADVILLRNKIESELAQDRLDAKVWTDISPLMPFADTVFALEETRREMIPVDPQKSAKALDHIAAQANAIRARIELAGRDSANALRPTKIAAYRAAEVLVQVRATIKSWHDFYDGYDPMFTWWTRMPYRGADTSITALTRVLRTRVVGIKPGEDDPIVGLPIGREAILADLKHEMIAYTPEELMAIAQTELTWGEREMKKAAREMGFGDDWKAAMEKVKQTAVPPGDQINLVRDLEFDALKFLNTHDLITVPPLAQDVWRIEMLSPERQKTSPFFLGGEILQVAYPTDSMSDDDKAMSMRGNNPHFSHATVFHEMIPGHHLQQFMTSRYFDYRREFSTPFWTEGGAFYWETIFWDLGFHAKPEDRIGALFWRMHRAARIIFSLNFHLGNWTPQQCIEFLIDKVGHERANAAAEVRRSFNGSYGPLYQVAYMMGGLEFRALHHEVVDGGKMKNKAFHDFIYTHGNMPVEMVRNLMLKEPLTADYTPRWKYAATLPPPGGGR